MPEAGRMALVMGGVLILGVGLGLLNASPSTQCSSETASTGREFVKLPQAPDAGAIAVTPTPTSGAESVRVPAVLQPAEAAEDPYAG